MNPAMPASLGTIPPAERAGAVAALLSGSAGEILREEIASWVTRLVPVETLVPENAARWRPLVADSLGFVFSHLSSARLAGKIIEQVELPPDTPAEMRLLRLIARMPGLQKIGQVLARNPRLPPLLRVALTELENGISDVSAAEIRSIVRKRLGQSLKRFAVRLDRAVLSEASVSAVIRFTWKNPNRERQRCVFKVLKPYIPACFAEDMELLQQLARYLGARERGYGFAIRDVDQALTEVRLLLEHELDFRREQATLAEAGRTYRGTLGIRVPAVIPALCTPDITAMTEEPGIKITEAFRRSPARRRRIAGQLIEALISVPLFSSKDSSVFHADPHAGNLLYDAPNRELVVLDWALAERLSMASRRQLVMLATMMKLQNRLGVRQAIEGLRLPDKRRGPDRRIADAVDRFFENLPREYSPGVLDAMQLLDQIALEGVRFAAPLFLFRKSLFTLDGIVQDLAGPDVRIDHAILRNFFTRWAGSFGLFYSPLKIEDLLALEWNALLYPARSWTRRLEASAPQPSPRRTPRASGQPAD